MQKIAIPHGEIKTCFIWTAHVRDEETDELDTYIQCSIGEEVFKRDLLAFFIEDDGERPNVDGMTHLQVLNWLRDHNYGGLAAWDTLRFEIEAPGRRLPALIYEQFWPTLTNALRSNMLSAASELSGEYRDPLDEANLKPFAALAEVLALIDGAKKSGKRVFTWDLSHDLEHAVHEALACWKRRARAHCEDSFEYELELGFVELLMQSLRFDIMPPGWRASQEAAR